MRKTERDEFRRAARRVMVAAAVEPERLLFVDERGVHASLVPISTATLPETSAYSCRCRGGTGARTRRYFLEHDHRWDRAVAGRRRGNHRLGLRDLRREVLVPSLRTGQIVVMDDLPAHRPRRIRELIEQQGCELLYLPAYSPDYEPVEEAFSKIKNLLRKTAARSKEALVEVIGQALSAVTAEAALGYIKHAGYRPTSQLL